MAAISIPGNKIQMVDLVGQHQACKTELDSAIAQVLAGGAFINGPQVKSFAQQLATYLDIEYVVPCANGTDALQIALMALNLQPGDEVITTSFNYVAAAEACALLGLTPVFAEVHPDTFNLNPADLERIITPNTKAIIAVHLFGQACDIETIMEIAARHKIDVIEDNAQSLGTDILYKGTWKKAGTIGHIGTTSFFPTKNLGCLGDGGALFTHDAQLAANCRSIATHGQGQRYEFQRIGVNSRLDTLQAALLEVKLGHLEDALQKRIQAASHYTRLLEGTKGLLLPAKTSFSSHSYNQFVVQITEGKRDALRQYLTQSGIPTMVYYPKPLHLQPAFQYLNYKQGDLSVSEQLCKQVLALPVHPLLEEEQISFICQHITTFLLA